MKINNSRLIFALFISVLFLTAYFVFISSNNVFQNYTFQHHISNKFPHANIIAMRISVLVTLLCTFRGLQNIKRQRLLMLVLMTLIIIGLLFPISFKSYPLIAGISNTIVNLSEPWRQLYVPPGLRATIEGITEGLSGGVDLLSVGIENNWSFHLTRYHYIGAFFIVLLVFFWLQARKLEQAPPKLEEKIIPKSILALFIENPYIFIVSLFCGINEGVFNYTFMVMKEIPPYTIAENYQYMLYFGSILGPMLIGAIADKTDIFLTLLLSCCFLIIVKIITVGCFVCNIKLATTYYILSLLIGGLVSSVATLNASLIGETLRSQGIFRAFAISNVIFGIGMLISGHAYQEFTSPLHYKKLIILSIDIFLILLLSYFYKKRPTPHSNNRLQK